MHSIEFLLKNFRYNPDSGQLFWKLRRSRSAPGSIAGSIDHEGYVIVALEGVRYRAHRIIIAMVYGLFPDQVDHVDGDRSNNRIKNLRLVNNQQNSMNQKIRRNNTSGVMGVCWHKRYGKWVAHIRVDGKSKYLGAFDVLEDASAARRSAEIENGFHENHGKR